MLDYYILVDKKPVVEPDLVKARKWQSRKNTAAWTVGKTKVSGIEVSTVFLGVGHQFGDDPLLLFGTMILGGEFDEAQWRYSTWDKAEAGHRLAVALVTFSQQLNELGGT